MKDRGTSSGVESRKVTLRLCIPSLASGVLKNKCRYVVRFLCDSHVNGVGVPPSTV